MHAALRQSLIDQGMDPDQAGLQAGSSHSRCPKQDPSHKASHAHRTKRCVRLQLEGDENADMQAALRQSLIDQGMDPDEAGLQAGSSHRAHSGPQVPASLQFCCCLGVVLACAKPCAWVLPCAWVALSLLSWPLDLLHTLLAASPFASRQANTASCLTLVRVSDDL